MNIYFSASIKGGRQLVERYNQIISYLKKYGNVLTEHIGDATYGKQGYKQPDDVYKEDTKWMQKSDVVIAEVSVPSLGVGYELAYCENLRLPILCLYDNAVASVSSMVLGNKYFCCKQYENLQQAYDIIDNFFGKITRDNDKGK